MKMIDNVRSNINLTISQDNIRYFTCVHPRIAHFPNIILCTKSAKNKLKFDGFSVRFNIDIEKKNIKKISLMLDISNGGPVFNFPVKIKEAEMVNNQLQFDLMESEYAVEEPILKEFLPKISKLSCRSDSIESVLNKFLKLFSVNVETKSKTYRCVFSVVVMSKSTLLKSTGSAFCLIDKRSGALMNFLEGKIFKNYLLESPAESNDIENEKKSLKRKRSINENPQKALPKEKKQKLNKPENVPLLQIHPAWYNYVEPDENELDEEFSVEDQPFVVNAIVINDAFTKNPDLRLFQSNTFYPLYIHSGWFK